jgi:UDP-2,3-diacylglucosamine hydrolase
MAELQRPPLPLFVVSDLHLGLAEDDNYSIFLEFLDRRVAASGASLLVAGDLFDSWYALPGPVPARYRPVVAALASQRWALWIEGNHDLRLERALAVEPEMRSLRAVEGPVAVEVAGRRLHVEHGDLVDPGERAYRALRWLLRSPLADLGARAVGGERALRLGGLAARLARRRHGGSRGGEGESGYDGRNPRWLAAARRHAAGIREAGAGDLVVLGHGHWLGWWDEGLICLGDWLHWRSYLEIDPGGAARVRRYAGAAVADPVLAESPVGALPRLAGKF